MSACKPSSWISLIPPTTSQDQQQTSMSLHLSLYTVLGPPSHTTPHFTGFGQPVHSVAYSRKLVECSLIVHSAIHWRGCTVEHQQQYSNCLQSSLNSCTHLGSLQYITYDLSNFLVMEAIDLLIFIVQ